LNEVLVQVLVNIGPAAEPSDVVELLAACHDRIRFFLDLAQRLSDVTDTSDRDIQDASGRIVRYFSEALPLHVADEEESIIPRLTGRDPALDTTLKMMHREHSQHTPDIDRLLALCRVLEASPQRLPELSTTLKEISSKLASDLNSHLREEEDIVLPAIRSLWSEEEQDGVLGELRARRSR
jgi:iron-sulfur cluster repair protein YtfE (RIC family)